MKIFTRAHDHGVQGEEPRFLRVLCGPISVPSVRNLYRHGGHGNAGLECGSAARRLLLLLMIWAAWAQRTGYAIPSNLMSQPRSPESSANRTSGHPGDAGRATRADNRRPSAEGKSSELHRNHGQASVTIPLPKRASPVKTSHFIQHANGPQLSLRGNVMNPRPPGWASSGSAARSGLVANPAGHHASPVRMASAVRPPAPSLSTVRHRSPNPAVVSGVTNLHGRNSAAINGTGMNRRP